MTATLPEIENLLTPISEDKPTGIDLRLSDADLTLSDIKEKRREVPASQSPSGEALIADWRGVAELARTALTQKTKDLELVAFLTEARLQLGEGFAALQQGLVLANELISRYWDRLHPGGEESGVEFAFRAKPISWMSRTDFLKAVRTCRITSDVTGRDLTWDDYVESDRVDQLGLQTDKANYQAALEAGYLTGPQWKAALEGAAPADLAVVHAQVEECREAAKALEASCDQRFTEDGPNLIELKSLLEDISEYLAKRCVSPEEGGEDGVGAGDPVPGGGGGAAPSASGPISSRQEAFRRLQEVSDFLRRTEPHSPVAHLVDRAVRWGGMTFEEVLGEVVKNNDVMASIRDTLGLGAPEPPS